MAAREMKQEPKNESGGRGRDVSFLSSPPLPALLLAPFFARCLTLVPRSLLLNRTETLATQAMRNSKVKFNIDLLNPWESSLCQALR